MSYEIIRGISVKKDGVYITSASNNVYPRTYYREQSPLLSNLLFEHGREAVDKAILRYYWGGTFQGGSNDYQRSIALFRALKKVGEYEWVNTGEKLGVDKLGRDIQYTMSDLDNELYGYYQRWKNRKKSPHIIRIGTHYYAVKYTTRSRWYNLLRAHAKVYDSMEAAIVDSAQWRYRDDQSIIPVKGKIDGNLSNK